MGPDQRQKHPGLLSLVVRTLSQPTGRGWALLPADGSSCVLSSGEGIWSNQGCALAEGNLSYSVCRCTHLTNFAILMQVVPLEVSARRGGALGLRRGAPSPSACSGGRVAGLCRQRRGLQPQQGRREPAQVGRPGGWGPPRGSASLQKLLCSRFPQPAPEQTLGPSRGCTCRPGGGHGRVSCLWSLGCETLLVPWACPAERGPRL